MATVKAFIRSSKKDKDVNIRFRLSDGRAVQLFYQSDITILPSAWDAKREEVKPKAVMTTDKRAIINMDVAMVKNMIRDIYEANKSITSEELDKLMDAGLHPEKQAKIQNDFFILFEDYLEKKKLSDVRDKNFRVLVRALRRYELFVRATDNKDFRLDIQTLSPEIISDFESFLKNEHTLYAEYPAIFEAFPSVIHTTRKTVVPKPRGRNTISGLFTKFRSFLNYCNDKGLTINKPFSNFDGTTTERYGTPYYLTLDERNYIADYNFSFKPQLAIQRDIFIFQCLVGCRVSDLIRLSSQNIIDGVLEYIPLKTASEHPEVVRVPLNERAMTLVARYKTNEPNKKLLPFISEQKYNEAIKAIFTLSGTTRSVTVLNSITGKEEKKPLNELASSHIARRTFIGNLYKKVKDPNLVGALSGHKEGSKAFARYREIDDDIKKDLVKLID